MKTVLITGASSGIGKATALLFAEQGWNVVAGMRNPELGDGLFKPENIGVVNLNVTNPQSIRNAINQTIEKFGSIDVLVNSAGYGLMGVFESMNQDQIRDQYDVNVFGLMNVTQAVLPHLRRQGSGTIVNLSSFGGVIALPFGTLYNSSKFAVEGFSEALALEVSSFNIKIKIVEPGSIDTNFRNNMRMVTGDIPEYKAILGSFFSRYTKLTEHIQKNTALDVAETIWEACTDNTTTLRYISGRDAEFYIDLKRNNSDVAFTAQMRRQFLQ